MPDSWRNALLGLFHLAAGYQFRTQPRNGTERATPSWAGARLSLAFSLELAVMLLPLLPCLLHLGRLERLLWSEHQILPRVALAPLEWGLHRRARHERALEQLE